MRRLARLIALFVLPLAACGAPPPEGLVARAPQLGKADGTDSADRACQVILRSLTRSTEIDHGAFVWNGVVDVAATLDAQVASVGILYRDGGGAWRAFSGTKGTTGTGNAGLFSRYTVRLDEGTTPTPLMDLRSWEYQRAEAAVYVELTDGTRRFDHNRVSSNFVNYELTPSNDFGVPAADGICPTVAPRAELSFGADFSETQRGPLVPGGTVEIRYATERLPACRWSRAGAQLWDTEALIKFQPQGILVTRSTTTVSGGARTMQPFTVAIPLGTQRVELWFRNYTAEQHCETYDSNFGANYSFPVTALGAPVAWAGDWGGCFSRDCVHHDGLAEPISIDSYVRERACKWVDADVYVPALTDGPALHPERLFAEVEWALDGAAQPVAPLQFVERVGNNYRYRWQLPYELTMSSWNESAFAFRFSHDGNTWLRLGADGGDTRTILRGF